MIPVPQTKFGEEGNCFAACMASILEMSISEMPEYQGAENELKVWVDWLKPFGFGLLTARWAVAPMGYSICEVKNGAQRHAVVCLDGKIKHDPLNMVRDPDEPFEAQRWYVLTVLDPKGVQ